MMKAAGRGSRRVGECNFLPLDNPPNMSRSRRDGMSRGTGHGYAGVGQDTRFSVGSFGLGMGLFRSSLFAQFRGQECRAFPSYNACAFG